MQIIEQSTKTLKTRDNGRSADAISPNFIYGCLGGCMKSYCYVGRYNHDKVYVNTNVSDIIFSIDKWIIKQPWPKVPNQCDPERYVIDIGCSTDIALMQKYIKDYLETVFFYFTDLQHHIAKFSFATKYPSMFHPKDFGVNLENQRIRISLMPQVYSDILEPKTDLITTRLQQIPRLQEDMEVHINFSPIIYTEGWLDEYRKLFEEMKAMGIGEVKAECIFMTYNNIQHERNSDEVNDLLWRPEIQEAKDSQYAPDNIRYKWQLKKEMVQQFISLYSEFYNPENIRYIF